MNVPTRPTLAPFPTLADTSNEPVFNAKVSASLPNFDLFGAYVDASNIFIDQSNQDVAAAALQVAQDLAASNQVLTQVGTVAAGAASSANDAATSAALAGASIQGTLQTATIGDTAVVVPDGQGKKIAYAPRPTAIIRSSGAAQAVDVQRSDFHFAAVDVPVATISLQAFAANSAFDTGHCVLTLRNEYLDDQITAYQSTGGTLFCGAQSADPMAISLGQGDQSILILDTPDRRIYQFDAGSADTIQSASYTNQSLYVASQTSSPSDFIRVEDWSRLFVFSQSQRRFYEYNETVPGQISSCAYTGVNLTLSSAAAFQAVTISPDRSKMIGIDASGGLREITFATAGTIAGATESAELANIGATVGTPRSIAFNPDGSKLYVLSFNISGLSPTVHQVFEFDCPTPGSIVGAQYTNRFLSLQSVSVNVTSICFSQRHNRLIICDEAATVLREFETQAGAVVFQPALTNADVPMPAYGKRLSYDLITEDAGASFQVVRVMEAV